MRTQQATCNQCPFSHVFFAVCSMQHLLHIDQTHQRNIIMSDDTAVTAAQGPRLLDDRDRLGSPIIRAMEIKPSASLPLKCEKFDLVHAQHPLRRRLTMNAPCQNFDGSTTKHNKDEQSAQQHTCPKRMVVARLSSALA